AVVAARLDPVQLVPRVLPELARPQGAVVTPGQALHVPVPEAVHRGAERVAGRRLARRRHPQDLPAEEVPPPSTITLSRVAGGDVQHPVRSEGDPPAVVI